MSKTSNCCGALEQQFPYNADQDDIGLCPLCHEWCQFFPEPAQRPVHGKFKKSVSRWDNEDEIIPLENYEL